MSATDLAALLKNLPPNSIAKIEILRTPSAKYDANGSGGLVNIVLKKGVKLGRNGSLSANLNKGKFSDQNIGFSLNNSNTKINSYWNSNLGRRNSEHPPIIRQLKCLN
jgi:outer membrane receptor for ferrienterochelin and colicin